MPLTKPVGADRMMTVSQMAAQFAAMPPDARVAEIDQLGETGAFRFVLVTRDADGWAVANGWTVGPPPRS